MPSLQAVINHKVIVLIARLAVGGIFVFAGIIKLFEPIEEFIAIGHQWAILPDPLLTWYITLLPWVELVFGIFILLGIFTRWSAVILALCLVSFLIGIVINMGRGRTLEDCGCFGSAFEFGKTFTGLLIRDIILLLFTFILMCTKQTWLSVDRYFRS